MVVDTYTLTFRCLNHSSKGVVSTVTDSYTAEQLGKAISKGIRQGIKGKPAYKVFVEVILTKHLE